MRLEDTLNELQALLNDNDCKIFSCYYDLESGTARININNWHSFYHVSKLHTREDLRELVLKNLNKLKEQVDSSINKLEKWS